MHGNSPSNPDHRYGQLLAEPIIRLAMKADGVEEASLRALLHRAAGGLKSRTAIVVPVATRQYANPNGEARKYRLGVGILLLNRKGNAFVGQRVDTNAQAWQLPQGGIENEEAAREAALRELREEIGTDNAEILHEVDGWLTYDLPPELARKVWGGRWDGQQQKWFVMRFKGRDSEINVATEHPEFQAWKWVPPEQLDELVVPFKRQLYIDVLREMRHATNPSDDKARARRRRKQKSD